VQRAKYRTQAAFLAFEEQVEPARLLNGGTGSVYALASQAGIRTQLNAKEAKRSDGAGTRLAGRL